jgi:hypothetical protein
MPRAVRFNQLPLKPERGEDRGWNCQRTLEQRIRLRQKLRRSRLPIRQFVLRGPAFGFFVFGIITALLAIPLQVLVVTSSIFLLCRRGAWAQLPNGLRLTGAIAVAAQATILLMTLLPPVIRPAWLHATITPVPSFAFILDSRFTSRGPDIAVNPVALGREWLIAAAVATGLCLLTWALRRRPVA